MVSVSTKGDSEKVVVNVRETKVVKQMPDKSKKKESYSKKFRGYQRGALSLLGAVTGVRLPGAAARNPYQLGKGQGQKYDRPGRPAGVYKYGMPIQEYKKLLNKRKALASLQYQKQAQELTQRGYSPEEIKQIQIRKQQTMQVQQAPTNSRAAELEFERQLAENTVSPNTMAILQKIKDIQMAGPRANIRMQRIKREQRMVADATNIMKTPSLFGRDSATINPLEVEGNILEAPNVFKKRDDMPNLMKTGRLNLLQTKEGGNDLKFF